MTLDREKYNQTYHLTTLITIASVNLKMSLVLNKVLILALRNKSKARLVD